MLKPIFKHYHQEQLYLLPPSIDEMIEKNHPVRIVNEVIKRINIRPLQKLYRGGGTNVIIRRCY